MALTYYRIGPTNDHQEQPVTTVASAPEPANIRIRSVKSSGKRLGSVWRHVAGESLEQTRKNIITDETVQESVVGKLSLLFIPRICSSDSS